MTYRLWVNDERTVLVRVWDDGTVEASLRMGETQAHPWGPPIALTEETVPPSPADTTAA